MAIYRHDIFIFILETYKKIDVYNATIIMVTNLICTF